VAEASQHIEQSWQPLVLSLEVYLLLIWLKRAKKNIVLKEVDFDVASAYSDEAILPEDQVRSLLSAADLFQMQNIFDACYKS